MLNLEGPGPGYYNINNTLASQTEKDRYSVPHVIAYLNKLTLEREKTRPEGLGD